MYTCIHVYMYHLPTRVRRMDRPPYHPGSLQKSSFINAEPGPHGPPQGPTRRPPGTPHGPPRELRLNSQGSLKDHHGTGQDRPEAPGLPIVRTECVQTID